jgi:hypothetical protein
MGIDGLCAHLVYCLDLVVGITYLNTDATLLAQIDISNHAKS